MQTEAFARRLGRWAQGKKPLYSALADAIRVGIGGGVIPVGSRLPAERILADSLAVSRTTVAAAYRLLEQDGFIERRRGSGTKVRRPAGGPRNGFSGGGTPPLPQGAAVEALLDNIDGTVDLTVPGFRGADAIPADMLTLDAEDFAAQLESHVGYLPSGLLELRERVARRLTEWGLTTSYSQVLITVGAQQGIALVAALLLHPGDSVVLESPTYYGAADAFRLRGARLMSVLLDHGGIDVEMLGNSVSALTPQMVYLTPTCNNPTGATLSLERRQSIARLAEGVGAYFIEDHAPAPLSFEDEIPAPIAALTDAENVITIGSIGKLFWPGLRVGWVRGPETFIDRLSRLKVVADLGSSLPSQLISLRLLPHFDQVRESRTEQLRGRLTLLEALMEELLPSWQLWPSAGGLYAWVKLPRGNAAQLAQIASRHGVTITPGNTLSVDGSHSDYVRLSLTPDADTLAVGLRRVSEAWEAYDTPVARRSTEPSVIV